MLSQQHAELLQPLLGAASKQKQANLAVPAESCSLPSAVAHTGTAEEQKNCGMSHYAVFACFFPGRCFPPPMFVGGCALQELESKLTLATICIWKKVLSQV